MTALSHAGDWAGRSLGERTASYDESAAILYALAIGVPADRLDLIFEDHLRVLPTFGLTLAQWAPDVLAEAGAYGPRPVHGAQTLEVHQALPRSGELEMSARVGEVWDKGSAAIFDVVVECREFTATWSIFAPEVGGFGGDRGPGRQPRVESPAAESGVIHTFSTQAALYRLTGDRHPIHIDPAAAAMIGQPRPIMHGLCTLGAAVLTLADMVGAHPADLTRLAGRFAGPVLPGDDLELNRWDDGQFEVRDGGVVVIDDGAVNFG